MEEKWDNV